MRARTHAARAVRACVCVCACAVSYTKSSKSKYTNMEKSKTRNEVVAVDTAKLFVQSAESVHQRLKESPAALKLKRNDVRDATTIIEVEQARIHEAT